MIDRRGKNESFRDLIALRMLDMQSFGFNIANNVAQQLDARCGGCLWRS
jgi:hypothetical protein